jgi:hypothetical protein
MGDPSDATEGTKGLPVAPPTPLAAGWYADPQSLDAAGLRYWDGSDAPRKPRGVRRSLVLWIASIAVVIAVAASGLGVWKVTVAKGLQDKTTVIDKQTATLQEETDELNAS